MSAAARCATCSPSGAPTRLDALLVRGLESGAPCWPRGHERRRDVLVPGRRHLLEWMRPSRSPGLAPCSKARSPCTPTASPSAYLGLALERLQRRDAARSWAARRRRRAAVPRARSMERVVSSRPGAQRAARRTPSPASSCASASSPSCCSATTAGGTRSGPRRRGSRGASPRAPPAARDGAPARMARAGLRRVPGSRTNAGCAGILQIATTSRPCPLTSVQATAC